MGLATWQLPSFTCVIPDKGKITLQTFRFAVYFCSETLLTGIPSWFYLVYL